MICKFLCIALLVCSFVQAAPLEDGVVEQGANKAKESLEKVLPQGNNKDNEHGLDLDQGAKVKENVENVLSQVNNQDSRHGLDLGQIPKRIAGVAHNFGDAVRETTHENVHKIQDNVQSVIHAGQSVFEAGKQYVQTGFKLAMSGPRFGAKVVDKVTNKDESEHSNGLAGVL